MTRAARGRREARAAQRPSSARRSGLREGGSAASQSRAGGGRRGPSQDAVGIIGLGLVGGSLAKAVAARYPRRSLIGVEPNAKVRALARREGIFEAVLARPSPALSRCGIVVLCAPVPAIVRLLGPTSRAMRDGAVLTDVGGVKRSILVAARKRVPRDIRFVGAHPMFGGERGGFASSRAEAWKGGTVAVCTDGADRRALETVARLHRALGARVVFCRAAEHDRAVAAVSHLLYVVASALALTARDAGPLAGRLAGKGLADTTRLAGFAHGVQGQAVSENARLPGALRDFERNLRRLRRALTSSAKGRRDFDKARGARESLVRKP